MTHPFDTLFAPQSIAVVGASDVPGKIGYVLMDKVRRFQGQIFPVNPKKRKLFNLTAYRSVLEIPENVDVALIAVPRQYVQLVVQECAEKGVKFGVLIASGFGEIGRKQEEEEILGIARKAGMRLLGPNCVGYGNPQICLNASFLRDPEPGGLGLITQSGGNAELLFAEALQGHLGFSRFAAIGNGLDLHFSELIPYFVDTGEITHILLYLESVGDGERFITALEYAVGKKPIIALKGGISSAGMRATLSHTGSLSTDAKIYNTLFRQFGVVAVRTLEELIDAANALRLPPLKGKQVAVLTNSGGVGVISADLLEQEGFTTPAPPKETQRQLSAILPDIVSIRNPFDLTVEAPEEDFAKVVNTLAATAEPDAFFFPYSCPGYRPEKEFQRFAKYLIQVFRKLEGEIPTVICNLPATALSFKKQFEAAGFPCFTTINRGVFAIKTLFQHSNQRLFPRPTDGNRYRLRESVAPILNRAVNEQRTLLDEEETRAILQQAGFTIPQFVRCTTLDGCLTAAQQLGFPLVMKVSSPTIVHKSDVGGVVINIQTEQDVREAFATIISNVTQAHPKEQISGILLSCQVPKGQELLLGIKRDQIFGSFIMLGVGGIFVEVFQDIAMRLAPVVSEEAATMIDELKAAPLLHGTRGQSGIDLEELVAALVRLSRLAVQCPEIQELDINPLIALPKGQGCHVADARIVVAR